jgi:hypothetical protein
MRGETSPPPGTSAIDPGRKGNRVKLRSIGKTVAALALVVGAACVPTTASATPAADSYWHASAQIFNSTGYVADANLWLNLDSGDVHAEVVGYNNGNIPGSVIKLQTSGYIDFRNIPHSWSKTVPAGQHLANTGDIRYNAYGNSWWWRACGYVGSGRACTDSWKFTYSGQGIGWDEVHGVPQTP